MLMFDCLYCNNSHPPACHSKLSGFLFVCFVSSKIKLLILNISNKMDKLIAVTFFVDLKMN